ncbi:MAG: hypothetical protein HQK53_16405 [Oligoflexia bacterium]|nr:hypothetical protein [Oligoflexia bacterium]
MPDEDPRSRIKKQIEHATSGEWGQTNAEVVGSAINGILESEVSLANESPELWSLSKKAELELPGLDEESLRVLSKKWTEFHKRYQDLNRFMNLIANSTENTNTWLKFDANLGLLKQNLWTCYTIYLDGIHVPIKLDRYTFGVQVNPKRELLSEEDMEKLVMALAGGLGEEIGTEEDALSSIRYERRKVNTEESMALNLLISDPHGFSQIFDKEKMEITDPDRLMTIEEVADWQNMVQELVKIGKKGVIVGRPGFGSYKRFEGIFQFGLGLALKITSLDSAGNGGSSFSINVPAPIHVGQEIQGHVICSVSHMPSMDKTWAHIGHGNEDLYWYKMAKRGVE